MDFKVEKMWGSVCSEVFTNMLTVEIVSTLHFTKYNDTSEFEDSLDEWSLEQLIAAFEEVSELYEYDCSPTSELDFGEPEYLKLANCFYEAGNLSDAAAFFVKPKKKAFF